VMPWIALAISSDALRNHRMRLPWPIDNAREKRDEVDLPE
jgi:hypothetical protein